jgi:small subunit ribosomal protein S20
MRTMIKKLRASEDAAAASALLIDVKAFLDRMSAKGIIHKNKAANYKSQLEKHVSTLA